MIGVENRAGYISGIGARILNSSLADKTRDILPETAKRILRQVVLGQKYPLPEPVVINLAGTEAQFGIRNYNDWYRIHPDFEGGFGRELIQTIKDRGGTFFDVGSAQGYYSIFAAKTGSHVYAFDPDPISQESLRANILLNPDVKDKILTMEIALGEKPGVMTLYGDKTGNHAPSLRRTARELKSEVDVEITTMDALVSAGTIPYPNVVKIDVEGAEGLVVLGMQGVLSSQERPEHVFIELQRKFLPLFRTTEKAVSADLVNKGYSLVSCLTRRTELLCHFRAY